MPGKKHEKITKVGRNRIEDGLNEGMSFSEIARILDVQPSTVSREVRRNRATADELPSKLHSNKNLCRKKDKCTVRALCPGGCLMLCSECKMSLCNRVCPEYEPKLCNKTQRAPYVCNGCWKILGRGCGCVNYYYDAKTANLKAESRKAVTRQGIDCSEEELRRAVELVKPLLKKGQSLEHIWATHADELPCSTRTFYRWINLGALDICNLDLPKKVTYKARKRKPDPGKAVDRGMFKGRTYEDFKNLDPADLARAVEVDCVEGKRGDKKVLLTLYIRRIEFQIMMLLQSHTIESVCKAFDDLESLCGDRFEEAFGIVLFDRGHEFLDAERIEAGRDGGRRCRAFYCDPLKPGQKGGAEKCHVEIRKVLPKGTSVDLLTHADVVKLCSHVNSYTRKALGGKSPIELAKLILPDDLIDGLGIEHIPPDDVILKPSLLNLAKRG